MMIRSVEGLRPLRARARRLLAIFPHPDDEAYGPAGALARAGQDPDAAAVVYCMTRGEASSIGPARGLSPPEVGALREQRLLAVAELLGLDGMLVGSFPDGGLARSRLDQTGSAIRGILRVYRPQVVIGHDWRGVNAHADHIATHWAIRHALACESGIRFAMLAYPPDVVEAAKPRLMFATPEEEIDAVLQLSPAETLAKERCLRVHEALITLVADSDPELILRPPVERYDFLGEAMSPHATDLFDGIEGATA